MFGRNKSGTTTDSVENDQADDGSAKLEAESVNPKITPSKGAPTPRRKDQEAARKRPLVPNDRAEARQAARDARRDAQLKTRAALDTGDERYLPLRDKGPQRRMVRDLVDVRTSPGEFMLVLALLIVIAGLIPTFITIQAYAFIGFWAFVLFVALDLVLFSRRVRKRLNAKFGEVERGVVWYAVMRSIQLRRLRLPKPQVQRGEKLDY